MANQSENGCHLVVSFLFIYYFFRVGKRSFLTLPCHVVSLWVESSARVFGTFEGVVEMRTFYPVDIVAYLIYLQWRRKSL